MTLQAVKGTWICTAWFKGEWVMVKKIKIKCKKGDFIGVTQLLVNRSVFFIVAHKVKNPNWPGANHLNGYIYKQGHSQDFSKGTHNFPHPRPLPPSPPPTANTHTTHTPQSPKSFQGIIHIVQDYYTNESPCFFSNSVVLEIVF